MATATGSITDSTAQDDIPENPHHPAKYKFSSAHFGKRKQCSMPSNLLGLASGSRNDFTSFMAELRV